MKCSNLPNFIKVYTVYSCPVQFVSDRWVKRQYIQCTAEKATISVKHQMGLVVTKSVFGVSGKARLKPVSSATETSQKIENTFVASLDMILFKLGIKNALISLWHCAGWSAPQLFPNLQRQVFQCQGPNVISNAFLALMILHKLDR